MMTNSAPKMTPKPSTGAASQTDKSARLIFISSVIDMSWQLLLVVLVPLIGGYKLDQHFKSSPLWLIVGIVITFIGIISVLRRTLNQLNQSFLHPGSKK